MQRYVFAAAGGLIEAAEGVVFHRTIQVNHPVLDDAGAAVLDPETGEPTFDLVAEEQPFAIPAGFADQLSAEEIEELGWLPLQAAAPPAFGLEIVSTTFDLVDGVAVELATYGPAPVPEAVDMRQAELKLLGEDRLDQVEALIATKDRLTQIEWRRALQLRRDHPVVEEMRLGWEMTPEDMDQWFREAAAIGPTLAAAPQE